MTLYDLIKIANDTLTPNTTQFYDYVLCTSEDRGGFLRTCFCKKSKIIKDIQIGERQTILIAFLEPFNPDLLTFKFEEPFRELTQTKLQFFYSKQEQGDLLAEKLWSKEVGYSHFIEITL